MKSTILILLLSLSATTVENYRAIFGGDYTEAEQFLSKESYRFYEVCANDSEVAILKAMVFPEVLRYSYFRNSIETTFLELLYVNHGTEGADFSIGRFQMKPSFLERLEKEIEQKLSNQALTFEYQLKEIKEIRKERITRLQTLEWQIKYLNAFYNIIKLEWGDDFPQKKENQIKWLATAYNRGTYKNLLKLKKHVANKYFPYGASYPLEQFCYAEIAYDFYLNTNEKDIAK